MKVRTGLREALSDPHLLGEALEGDSWHAWRTILLATMREPLTDAELATFQAVTGREKAPTEPCKELIGIIGRRGSLSSPPFLSTLIDYRDVLVAGERGLLLCAASDLKQAAIVQLYLWRHQRERGLATPRMQTPRETAALPSRRRRFLRFCRRQGERFSRQRRVGNAAPMERLMSGGHLNDPASGFGWNYQMPFEDKWDILPRTAFKLR